MMLRNRRNAHVQQLSLLDVPLPQNQDPAVWNNLDDEKRTLAVGLLARLIVKLTAARKTRTTVPDQEKKHD